LKNFTTIIFIFDGQIVGKQLQALLVCNLLTVFQFLGTFAKSRKAALSFVLSVRLHGTTWFTLDGYSWNLVFEYFL